jgi:hypothetical protein
VVVGPPIFRGVRFRVDLVSQIEGLGTARVLDCVSGWPQCRRRGISAGAGSGAVDGRPPIIGGDASRSGGVGAAGGRRI